MRTKDVVGSAALVLAMLGTASVFIWHSEIILSICMGLAGICFGLTIFFALRESSQREREEALRLNEGLDGSLNIRKNRLRKIHALKIFISLHQSKKLTLLMMNEYAQGYLGSVGWRWPKVLPPVNAIMLVFYTTETCNSSI